MSTSMDSARDDNYWQPTSDTYIKFVEFVNILISLSFPFSSVIEASLWKIIEWVEAKEDSLIAFRIIYRISGMLRLGE